MLSRSSKSSKLAELRQKTDRQLLIVIQNELERGLTLADLAASKESALYARAERAWEKAKSLLPKINGVNTDERRQLEHVAVAALGVEGHVDALRGQAVVTQLRRHA